MRMEAGLLNYLSLLKYKISAMTKGRKMQGKYLHNLGQLMLTNVHQAMKQKYSNLSVLTFLRTCVSKEIVQLLKIHWMKDRKVSNNLTLKAGSQGTFLGQYSPEILLLCQERFMHLMQKSLKQGALPRLFHHAMFPGMT